MVTVPSAAQSPSQVGLVYAYGTEATASLPPALMRPITARVFRSTIVVRAEVTFASGSSNTQTYATESSAATAVAKGLGCRVSAWGVGGQATVTFLPRRRFIEQRRWRGRSSQ